MQPDHAATPLHPLLERQLRRLRLDPTRPPEIDEWRSFLGRVASAYCDADERNYLTERALVVSSGEMAELHAHLHASRARLSAVFDTAHIGLCVLDAHGTVETVNPAALHQLRREETDVRGHLLWDVMTITTETDAAPPSRIDASTWDDVCAAAEPWRADDAVVCCGDVVYPAACALTPILAEGGQFGGAVLVLRDVTEQRRAQSELHWRATHDLLTGLPNRAAILRRLTEAVERCRDHGADVAVMFIDLDRFKAVNDTHGHAAGDELLKAVAARITSCVRDSDTVGRLAGDEFVVVCGAISADDATRIGERIASALAAPVRIAGKLVSASASVGIATFRPGRTAAALLGEADQAMYAAKRAGTRVAFHPDLQHRRATRNAGAERCAHAD